MSAVVRDKKGRFVSDLSREDFIVTEGGERRSIVGFQSEADGPVGWQCSLTLVEACVWGRRPSTPNKRASYLQLAEDGLQAALFAFDTQLRSHRLHCRLQRSGEEG